MNSIKEYLAKYFTNVFSVLTLLGCLAFAYKWYHDVEYERTQREELEARYGRLVGTEESGESLGEGLYQLRTKYLEKSKLEKKGHREWLSLQVAQEERLKSLQKTVLGFGGSTYTQGKPDRVFHTLEGTKGYEMHEIRLQGADSPPLGYVMLKKDGTIQKKSYEIQIEVENARVKDDFTGKVRVVTKAYLIPQEDGLAPRNSEKSWKGEKIPLEIKGGILEIDPIEPLVPVITTKDFIWWTMNLNGGFGAFGEDGEVVTRAILDVNLVGYGLSKRDLDWKFAHVGVNYSNEKGLGLHIMPFTYRPLPDILTNTYTGVGYYQDTFGKGYFLGLNIGF